MNGGSHTPILSGLTLDIQCHYDYREYKIARLQKTIELLHPNTLALQVILQP